MKHYLIIVSGLLSMLYILNPGFGIFELIPDNIPVVGNLDEGAAAYVIISVIAYLTGKDFGLFSSASRIENSNKPSEEKP